MKPLQEDLRIRRTKRLLKEAFIELLSEKPLDKLTVNMLAERAEINRATFYLHYKDMKDFIEQFIDELYIDLDAIFNESYDVPFTKEVEQDFLEKLLLYIEKHQEVFKSLLVSKNVPYFTQMFMEMIQKMIARRNQDQLSPNSFFDEYGVEHDFVSWYVSSALIGTISLWLGNDLKYSARYMAMQIMRLNPFRNSID